MEPISTSIIASLIGALFAWLAKKVIDRISDRAGRKLVVKDANGKEKSFDFDAGLPPSKMLEAIRNELELEQSVKSLLDIYMGSIGQDAARVGKFVDFIADFGTEKIAVEVKNNLRHFDPEIFSKYLSEEPNLKRLILFTPGPVKPEIRERASLMEKEGKLQFVVLKKDQDSEDQVKQIADAFSSARGA